MTFLGQIREWSLQGNLYFTIWTDRQIHKVIVKICLPGVEGTGAVYWQENLLVIFLNCQRLILDYHENEKLLRNMVEGCSHIS